MSKLLRRLSFSKLKTLRHRMLPGAGARMLVEEELDALKADYDMLLDHLPAMVLYMDRDGRCLKVNRAAAEFAGIPQDEYVGKLFSDINPRGEPQLADNREVIRTGMPKHGIIEQVTLKDGSTRWVQTDKIPRRDANGEVIGVVVFAVDITERRHAEEQVARLASRDPLTDLCNRRAFADRLEHTLASCARRERRCALIFVDLNRFKEVNDAHGHDVGDEVLVQVSQRLRRYVRAEDTVSRLGGDEFVVLLSSIGATSDALIAAQSLSEALMQPIVARNVIVSPAASIGVAVFPDHGATGQDLMRAADRAMYLAKSSGESPVKLAVVSVAA